MRDGKKVILLVEGDTGLIAAEKDMLGEQDCIIEVVENGIQALDYLKSNASTTDMVVVALNLPVLGGMELLEILQLSKRMRVVPFVMLIPEEKIDVVGRVLDRGAEDVIIYPLESAVAMRRIRNIMISKLRPQCVNVMEEIVEKELDKCIGTLGVCTCRKCRLDVLTLSLNRMKPRYVTSEKGRLLSTVEQMSWDYIPDIIRTITECAEIVRKNPHHED